MSKDTILKSAVDATVPSPLPLTPAVYVDGGKGGVGKTVFAVNLTVRLAELYRLAFAGFDVDSDNAPDAFGLYEEKDGERVLMSMEQVRDAENRGMDRRFQPQRVHVGEGGKIKVASPALIPGVDGGAAFTLSGQGNAGLISTLVHNVVWGFVDLTVVDLPAGSSDEWGTAVDTFEDVLGIFVMVHPNNIEDLYRTLEKIKYDKHQIIGVVEVFGSCVFSDGAVPVHPKSGEAFNPWGRDPSNVEAACKGEGLEYLGNIGLTDGVKRVNNRLTLPGPCMGPVERAVEIVKGLMPEEVPE